MSFPLGIGDVLALLTFGAHQGTVARCRDRAVLRVYDGQVTTGTASGPVERETGSLARKKRKILVSNSSMYT